MRIMWLSHTPRNPSRPDDGHVTELLRSYTSPGTELDVYNVDDFEGARVMRWDDAGGRPVDLPGG